MKKVGAIIIVIVSTLLMVISLFAFITFVMEIKNPFLLYRFLLAGVWFPIASLLLLVGTMILSSENYVSIYSLSGIVLSSICFYNWFVNEIGNWTMLSWLLLAPIILINSLLILFSRIGRKKATGFQQSKMNGFLSYGILAISLAIFGLVLSPSLKETENLSIGQTVKLDENVEMTVTDIFTTQNDNHDDDDEIGGITVTIKPNAGIETDEVYLYTRLIFKNNSSAEFSPLWINHTVVYGDEAYEFTDGFSSAENIERLSEGKYYHYTKIKKDTLITGQPMKIKLMVVGKKYEIDLQSLALGQ